MTLRKSNPYLTLVNSYLIDSPQPSSINYWWNLGSLLGLCLVIQLASGIFLAMHYSSNIELAFNSVEHIMRDVNAGWLIRYIHANGASFFFICMYLHIGKALYYGSYKSPRVLVWAVGVIIFILTMATAFMGYCLVYGQMSHWGATVITNLLSAIPFIGNDIVPLIPFLPLFYISLFISFHSLNNYNTSSIKNSLNLTYVKNYISTSFNRKVDYKINKDILALIVGFIDGDGYIRITKKSKDNKNYIYISLIINLHINETETLIYFNNILKIGKVYNITSKNKKLIRLEINKTDIINKLIPLLNEYNISFLTVTRQKQYLLLKYIISNNILYYEDIIYHKNDIDQYINHNIIVNNFNKLDYFNNWLVGFTMAEGSFIVKKNKDICFQLKQKYNFELFKDISLYLNTTRKLTINKDKYVQLGVSSINDIQNIINFFSFSNNQSLIGNKLLSYNKWLLAISESKRYNICIIPKDIIREDK